MTEPFIRFDRVGKTYGGLVAVRPLALDLYEGEFLTLLGPSGSGKTTMLMMLAGFEAPTAGRILRRGAPIDHLPPQDRNFGVVFQSYALFPRMTVAENIAYPLKVRKHPRAEIEKRVAAALAAAQLSAFADRLPAFLSGGQRQRVAVARALVFKPQVVLMDEPLSALDRELRQHLQFEIKHLHDRFGLTIVYVTHDQDEALTMSDRVAVFRDGAIEQVADPRTLYDQPATRFVAGFIGQNNLFPARVTAVLDGEAVFTLDGGATVRGTAAARTGDAVTVCVRPEALVLGGDGLENTLRVTVEEIIFKGQHIQLVGRSSAGKIVAYAPASGRLPSRGDTTTLGWPSAATRCITNVGST